MALLHKFIICSWKKLKHRLSALPQPYCRLFVFPRSSLPAAYQPCSSPAAVFSFSVSISFFLLFHSFVIAVLPSQWFSPCVHPCTPMLHLFGWHLKQVTVIPHNNIMPFFEYILSIFQVLLPDQPERSETNIKSKQPIYLPTILISGHKNAPVRRTWKMDKS